MKSLNTKIFFGCLLVAVLMASGSALGRVISGSPNTFGMILRGFVFTFLISYLISVVNMSIYNFIRKNEGLKDKFVKRFLIEIFITSVSASVIISSIVLILYFLNFQPENWEARTINMIVFGNCIVACIINFIAILASEAHSFFLNWKQTAVQAESLKRENSEAQLDALKNQINPHFLFNSLNTLSSLISISPERAKEYISQFSKVYRFLLNVRDKAVVEIKEELDFLNSYIYLQQIRFGNNFSVEIKIDSTQLTKLIPVIALQTLVENCVKHNEISTQFPLKVKITNDDKFIYVTNNFQPKQNTETSTGTGIINLKKRYSFFSDITPEFYLKNNQYIAKIPMIEE